MDPPCFVRTGGQLPPAQIVIVVIFFDENVNYHRKTKKYNVICQLHSYLSVCSEIIGQELKPTYLTRGSFQRRHKFSSWICGLRIFSREDGGISEPLFY